ncbi:MAG: hemolysin family protein [Micrococcaceae bacterium]
MISNTIILSGIIIIAIIFIAIFTVGQLALRTLPTSDAEEVSALKRNKLFKRIVADPSLYVVSLRFWRIFSETLMAAAIAVLVDLYMGSIWKTLLISTFIIGIVSFIIVAATPGKLNSRQAFQAARLLGPIIFVLRHMLGPIPAWLVSLGTRFYPNGTGFSSLYEDFELRDLALRAGKSNNIEEAEATLITSVVDFSDTLVREVMVPRPDMITIEEDATLSQALRLCLRSGFSRIPIIGNTIDEVTGVLYLKDITARIHLRKDDPNQIKVSSISRPVRFVPEFKNIDDLLKELQKESTHVAIVIDEYGGTAGLVTLEDIIEELVGEIVDEYDNESPEIEKIDDDKYRVSARLSITDLGELFNKKLDDEDVDSVGGLLTKYLGRIPILGSTIDIEGLTLTADQLEGRRNRLSYIIVERHTEQQHEELKE